MQKKLPSINSAHGSETRNIINEIIKTINDRGLEILSESGFLTWLDKNGIKHREEVATFSDLPSNDSLNTVRGVEDENKIYIKKENGWVPFQTIDVSKINDLDEKMNEVQFYARDFGVVADGTTDNTTALKNALTTANGGALVMPQGIVKIDKEISYNGKVNLKGTGDNTVIDLSGGGTLNFKRDLLNIPKLSTNIKKGTSTVNFSADHGLSEGDVFIVYNPTDFSWSNSRDYYRDGCMFKVDLVDSSKTVRIYGVSPDNYNSNNMNCYKMRGEGISIKDIKIIPNSNEAANVQIFIDGHKKVDLYNVEIPKGSSYTAIEVHRCYDFNATLIKAEVKNGDAYPISISNTQKVTLSQSPLYSSRHALALGGRSGPGCVPTRDILIDQTILTNRSSAGTGAADMHGNIENVTYSNCILDTGAIFSGKNVKYTNCTIFGRDTDYNADGQCVFGNGFVGGSFEISNCRLVSTGTLNPFGMIHLNVADRKEPIDIIIKDIVVDTPNVPENKRVFVNIATGVDVGYNSNAVHIDIDNIHFINDFSVALAITNTTKLPETSTYVVDNIKTKGPITLVSASNIENLKPAMRLQKQSGRERISTEIGIRTKNTNSIPLKYRYPRVPNVNTTVNMVKNMSQNFDVLVQPGTFYLSDRALTLNINSGSAENWTGVEEVDLMWEAYINEV